MIAKGLKVGDTFIDGKLLYKVIDISSQGYYVSSLVGKAGGGAELPKEESVKDEHPDHTAATSFFAGLAVLKVSRTKLGKLLAK